MRLKFTIAICALLVLGLAVAEVNAQGYKVSIRQETVVAGGHNQELGAIRLTFRTAAQGGFDVTQNNTIEITFGDLYITNAAAVSAATNLNVGAAPDGVTYLTGVTAAAANHKDTKVGKVTLNFSGATLGAGAAGSSITLEGILVDVSGLEDGDTIMAKIAATGTGDNFNDITSAAGTSVTAMVSTVKDGLNVTAVGQVSVLNCDKGVGSGRMPSITVEEGFNDAWQTDAAAFAADGADGAISNSTHIRVVVANVPTGVTFRWPGDNRATWNPASTTDNVPETDTDNYFAAPDNKVVRTDGADAASIATLAYVESGAQIGNDKTKHFVLYVFEGLADDGDTATKEHGEVKNSFKISPMITVDTSKTGAGGVSDAWAQLWPAAKTGDNDDRVTKLTYTHAVETKDEGYFVNVTECVTYLLFPFLTCGAQADWTTGISVANTSKDDEVFPVNKGAAPQGGSVMIHAYPKSTAEEKMAMGHMSSPDMLPDPISTTISGNLAAGDTVAVTCNMDPMLAGFEGYAIARAAFRHAHGMAFVLGNFQDGAAVDVAHGYIALVIPDPEFEADAGGPQGRGAGDGESLGQ